jgi:hypothetical protein
MHFLGGIKKNMMLEVAKQNKIEECRWGDLGGKQLRYISADPAIRGLFLQDTIVEMRCRANSLEHNTWIKNGLHLRFQQSSKRPRTGPPLGSCRLILNVSVFIISDRLSGLVVRVPGYRSRVSGFDSRRYQIV